MTEHRFLNFEDARKRLTEVWGLTFTKNTMNFWASKRTGPPCFKSERRRVYRIDELDAWAQQRLKRRVSA
jgi:hypothetical protein